MSDSQWNYLGLSHNPFSDPQKEFYPGADREALLSKVRKLSQWSRPILAVTGPHGVGKTCLFRALSSSLEAGVVAARVNGSLVSRAGDVLSALVQGYGVAAPSGADAPLLIELIIAHLKDQSQNDRTSLVLVDDAHLLEQRAVDDLVNLAAAGARLAFFSEPQFVESLQRAVERNAETSEAEPLLWNEMLLSPFSREQTSEYLEWRFDEAGYNGRMPFSEHQVDGIHRSAEGFPGRLDFAANEQLMQMTVGGPRTAGIPRKHLWLAGTLALVLGLVFWLWSPADEPPAMKTRTVELPDQKKSRTTSGSTSAQSRAVAEAPASASRAPTTQSPPLSRTVQPVERPAATPQPPPEQQSRTVRVESVPTDVPGQSTATVVRRTPVTPTPAATQTAKPSTSTTRQPATPKPAVAQPASQPKPEPTPAPRPTPAPAPASTSSGNAARDASWLLAQNDASYTIQLIGFGEAARARAYLGEQQNPGPVCVVPHPVG